jgi:hypothetical protein
MQYVLYVYIACFMCTKSVCMQYRLYVCSTGRMRAVLTDCMLYRLICSTCCTCAECAVCTYAVQAVFVWGGSICAVQAACVQYTLNCMCAVHALCVQYRLICAVNTVCSQSMLQVCRMYCMNDVQSVFGQNMLHVCRMCHMCALYRCCLCAIGLLRLERALCVQYRRICPAHTVCSQFVLHVCRKPCM